MTRRDEKVSTEEGQFFDQFRDTASRVCSDDYKEKKVKSDVSEEKEARPPQKVLKGRRQCPQLLNKEGACNQKKSLRFTTIVSNQAQ